MRDGENYENGFTRFSGLRIGGAAFFLSFVAMFSTGISNIWGWKVASKVLLFPLSLVPDAWWPESLSWLTWPLWILLSFGWALAIFYGLRLFSK